ncbi:ABC transporter substrate-binding protein [Nonomuraea sp. NPDC050556]|uniref:ABC transporter substrate-binding protein n=1 Tax=Nonomuraea sp. NPDC050556 TaxID=3364369 RepID=UPI00379E85A3
MGRRLVAAALALLVIAGCSAPKPVTQAPPPQNSTFVYVENTGVITDWDPATSYSNEIIAMQNIYESLTVWNPVTRKASPRLATSWRTSTDGKTWTFTLRQGVRFHTGKTMDAASVKAAIERTIASKSTPAYIWGPVDSISTDNPLTITFTLKYPAPLDLIASAGYASYIYDPAGVDKNGKTDGGTGPYTIDNWRKGKRDELTLKAFDGYWGGWDRPHYTKVNFQVSVEQDTSWRRLLHGDASFLYRLNSGGYHQARGTAGVRTSKMPSFQTMMLLFNTASGPLTDVRVRRALQKSVNYSGLIKAMKGGAVLPSGLVPPGLFGHVSGRPPRQDLAAAARLFARAGYGPGGKPLTLSLTYAEGDEDQKLMATTLAKTLSQLDVTLVVKAMPWEDQWALGKKGGQDIFAMYWWPDYADAYSYFGNVFRSSKATEFNLSYLKDPVVDDLIDRIPELTVSDRAAAARTYAQLTSRVLDLRAAAAVPWVVTYQRAYLGGVQGYDDNPAYPDVVFAYDLWPSG